MPACLTRYSARAQMTRSADPEYGSVTFASVTPDVAGALDNNDRLW